MPPIDLSALKDAQARAARARATLGAADAGVADTRAALRRARAALEAATLAGDRTAAGRAAREADAAAGELDRRIRDRDALDERLRDALKDFASRQIDAPGDVPLLLMPLRLETRFGNEAGRPVLRIRIHPDEVHLDDSDPGLTAEEAAAARIYWNALFLAADDSGMDAAWTALKTAVGRRRARAAAQAMRPLNPAERGTGAAAVFPEPSAPSASGGRFRLLPERFHVTAWQGGRQLRATGAPVAADLRVRLLPEEGAELIDRDGLKLPPGGEWLTDYGAARDCGMALDLPLPAAVPIERLYVYGICQSRDTAETAAEFEALLASHDGSADLAFVPQGTSTNNSEAESAGWDRWADVPPVPLTPAPLPPDSNGAAAAAALGTGAGVLAGIPHAGAREQDAAGAMNAALWPATWGYFLDTLDEGQSALDPFTIEVIRQFHESRLRGRGGLPAIRVGRQPYGLLAFDGFPADRPDPGASRTEKGLAALMQRMKPGWTGALDALPRIAEGADGDTVRAILGHAPLSWGVVARRCLSRGFVQAVQTVSTQGKAAADVEALLNALLAESLGGYSLVHAPGSLDSEGRPVALPYADPARDADVLRALLDGKPAGAISSVFQALAVLGWQRAVAQATPGPRFAEAVRASTDIDAATRERIIGVTALPGASVTEYDGLLDRIPQRDISIPRRIAGIGQTRDYAERAMLSSSAAERIALSEIAIRLTVSGGKRLAALRSALAALIALADTPEGRDFTALVAETLDTASHRLDSWILGLSASRLARMRAAQPGGLAVGAFGWVVDLAPQRRGRPQGGHVAAPTLEQATTAGLLRSAYLAHNPGDASAGAFAVDLTSGRVRRAIDLLSGVANGQPLGALLGYDFERRLHEADCDRFILTCRGLAPLVAGQLTDADAPAGDPGAQAAAGANVTDMLRLLERWNTEGAAAIFKKLADRPEGNEYLDPAQDWPAPTGAEQQAIAAAMAQGADDADAVADLLLAESVHQMAQGNMARASATMDAAGKGEAPPPAEPDVVMTGGPGVVVSHRLIVAAPESGGWSVASPRAIASPAAEAWAAARLPDPARVALGPKDGGGTATLADAGLSALDFAAASRHPERLLFPLIRARTPLANPDAAFPDAAAVPGPDAIALEEAALAGAALQEVLDRARPLDGLSLGLPGAAGWQPAPGEVAAAIARLASVSGLLQSRGARLAALLSAPSVARADLTAALMDLGDFGIDLPSLSDKHLPELGHLALSEAGGRLARAQAALAAPASPQTVATAAEALFGPGLPVALRHVFAPADPAEPLGERPFAAPPPGAVERYLADCGSVRPALAPFSRLMLISDIFGRAPAFQVRQLCGRGENPPDDWIGTGLPPDRRSPGCPIVSLVADAPDGLDLTAGVTGFLIDDWSETMPLLTLPPGQDQAISRTTAGVALHADAPRAQPPQALVLALSPDGARWTEDGLCAFLSDLFDLARMRLVTLETLPLAARILPAIYTQSWSLQGQPVIDWTRIALDARTMARMEGLRNFTMTKKA